MELHNIIYPAVKPYGGTGLVGASSEASRQILAAGYRKPHPPTTEAIDAAAQAVYAKTQPSASIAWELLPRIVQHEIREVALTAINAATAATP